LLNGTKHATPSQAFTKAMHHLWPELIISLRNNCEVKQMHQRKIEMMLYHLPFDCSQQLLR